MNLPNLKSRKVQIFIFSIVVLALVLFVSGHWTSLVPMFGTFCGCLSTITLGFLGAHAASDIGHHYLEGKDDNKSKE